MSDGVVLVGLSGSGKSTIGRSLARVLGRPFVDTDELIAREGPGEGDAGARLRSLGEPTFRAAETRAIGQAVAVGGAVVATGGGAPGNERARAGPRGKSCVDRGSHRRLAGR